MDIISNNPKPTKQKNLNREEWAILIAEWQAGTESQKDFCERLNLNINTFTYIKGKLAKKNKSAKFLPVKIVKDTTTHQPILNVILENAKGIKLHINFASDETLIHLLKIVGW